MSFFSCIGRPAIFLFAPEKAHELAIAGLKTGLIGGGQVNDPKLNTTVAGIDFPNPLGLAAGFDKNADVVDATLKLGFGFTEIGTVTPRFQAGNQKPRLFRLVDDEGLINRMGFNNAGQEVVYNHLLSRCNGGVVGVNIGANKDSQERIHDYVLGVERFYDVAAYFTVNISSPNTPGLRDLQNKESLTLLAQAISSVRAHKKEESGRFVPTFLKIAPDLTEQALDDIAGILLDSDFDGLIVSNTTLSRHGLKDGLQAKEKGGLSGRPIFDISTTVLAKMRRRVGQSLPIIGVGGVESADTLMEKVKAGADLAQLYTPMIYKGPQVVAQILRETLKCMEKDGIAHISQYRDLHVDKWADRSLL